MCSFIISASLWLARLLRSLNIIWQPCNQQYELVPSCHHLWKLLYSRTCSSRFIHTWMYRRKSVGHWRNQKGVWGVETTPKILAFSMDRMYVHMHSQTHATNIRKERLDTPPLLEINLWPCPCCERSNKNCVGCFGTTCHPAGCNTSLLSKTPQFICSCDWEAEMCRVKFTIFTRNELMMRLLTRAARFFY